MSDDDTIAPDDGKLATSTEDILAELRKRVQWSVDFDADTRSEALEDLRFVAGQQWPDQWRRTRELESRPCLTINKLPAFIHQITNDQRQNKPSIKLHPVDDHADIETAKIMQGMVRHIEYASNADFCYDTATQHAVEIGFGYFRLVTEYCDEASFDQEIRFKRVRNPFTVYCGPHMEPDGSDMKWCVISEEVPRDEFKREYPNAEACGRSDWPTGPGDSAISWLSVDSVRVAEYYRIEDRKATLVMLADGSTGYKDELPKVFHDQIVRERESSKRVVMWRKCTALEILEEQVIPGRYIPVFPVYGDEIDLDGKVIRSGVVRWAKDPQRMYNFHMTAATEEVALRPKTPFIMAEGQDEGYENQWRQANNRSFAYLRYKPTTVDGILVPPPQRSQPADIPNGMLTMAMHANDNIKATTGIFDASLGARSNEQSGRAILARQREGDVANYHYIDNLTRAIRHAGRVILSWIPVVYDTERIVRILGEDESLSYEKVNAVEVEHEVDEATGMMRAIERVKNDIRIGKYDVTVTTGPSYTTMRQEAAEAMVQFGQSWPRLMEIAGDKVVKAMDWPGAEEIAKRIEKTIPPELRQEEGEGKDPLPPEVTAQIEQAAQYIQLMQAENQQLKAALQDKDADRALEQYKIDVDATTKVLIEEMKQAVAPLQDLGSRVQSIEAALTTLADVLVPAPVMGTGFTEGMPQ